MNGKDQLLKRVFDRPAQEPVNRSISRRRDETLKASRTSSILDESANVVTSISTPGISRHDIKSRTANASSTGTEWRS